MSLIKWNEPNLPLLGSWIDNFFNNDVFQKSASVSVNLPLTNVLETDESFELERKEQGRL